VKAPRDERFRLVQELPRRRGLPRWVVLADGDRTLPVDLDNVVGVASLAALVARREGALLTELFPAPDELVAEGPEGRFAHQLVVPFVRRPAGAPVATAAAVPPSARPAVRRTFAPGSEWLSVKLYAGAVSADDVLTDLVAPLVARARRAKTISRWFFRRDADPHWHLRVAFRGEPARLTRMLSRLDQAAAPLLADGRLLRIAVDTYDRDVERHGGEEGVELAEAVFEADSDAALAIMADLESATGAGDRWRLALRGCHDLLVDLGLDLAARTEVVQRAYESLALETRVDKALEHGLGARFRKERASLEELLVADAAGAHRLAPGLAVLAERSARVRPIAVALRAHERAGRLGVRVRDQAARFLRMHCSRLLRSDLREQALVIHELLRRLYVSEAARARPSPRPESQA
jgi:thiopeptide-type bacteriocin biosynthesis protein